MPAGWDEKAPVGLPAPIPQELDLDLEFNRHVRVVREVKHLFIEARHQVDVHAGKSRP